MSNTGSWWSSPCLLVKSYVSWGKLSIFAWIQCRWVEKCGKTDGCLARFLHWFPSHLGVHDRVPGSWPHNRFLIQKNGQKCGLYTNIYQLLMLKLPICCCSEAQIPPLVAENGPFVDDLHFRYVFQLCWITIGYTNSLKVIYPQQIRTTLVGLKDFNS